MPSCYNCKYTNFNRTGDITIGDFWGIEKNMSEFDDNKGVSLVLVNSQKGKVFFDSIRANLIVRESSKDKCLQSQLKAPAQRSELADKVYGEYDQKGLRSVMAKCTEYGCVRTFIKKVILKLKSMLAS